MDNMKVKYEVMIPRSYITTGFVLFFTVAVAIAYVNIMSSLTISNVTNFPFKPFITTSEAFYLFFGMLACLNQSILLFGVLSGSRTVTRIGVILACCSFPAFLISGNGVINSIADRSLEVNGTSMIFDIHKYGYDDTVTVATNVLQKKYKCCGWTSFDDYSENEFFSCVPTEKGVLKCIIPASCCEEMEEPKPYCLYERVFDGTISNDSSEFDIKQVPSFGELHTKGCFDALNDHLLCASSNMAGFIILMYIWQFCSLWITIDFSHMIRKEIKAALIKKFYFFVGEAEALP